MRRKKKKIMIEAAKLHILVGHVEAGFRSFDRSLWEVIRGRSKQVSIKS